MTKTTTIVGLLTALILGTAHAVTAQVQPAPLERGFLNINAGAQPQSRSFVAENSFPLYGETARVSAAGHVANGPIFDINGGWHVGHDVSVGVGFTSFSDKDASVMTATIPHPLVVNFPRTVSAMVDDLRHTERAVYLQLVYRVPVTAKIDAAFNIGPTFISTKQGLVTSATVAPGTQNATPVVEEQSKRATGIIVGFDGSYMFSRAIGAGLFIRYAGAKVDLPSVPDLKVGGFQAGLGARVRF
jgi:hypothetical protein